MPQAQRGKPSMLKTKKTMLLRVLGYMGSVLLVIVSVGGAQVPPEPIPPETPPANPGLAGPRGLVFGPDGNLYVSSYHTDEVLRYDGVTGTLLGAFVTQQSGGLAGPRALTFGPDNSLYVSSGDANEVLRYDGTTGAFLDAFVGDNPETPDVDERGPLATPRGIVFGPADGHLYVSSRDTDEVLRYDGTTGVFLDFFVANESGGLNHPTNLTFGPDGNLYVNGYENDQVLRYDGTTGAFLDIFVADDPATLDIDETGGLRQPLGITFGPDGNLYVSPFNDNQVFRYDGATGALIDAFVSNDPATAFVDETGGLDRAAETLFDPVGNLLVSSFGNNQVMRYDINGAFQGVFAPQPGSNR
jgi:streptogramin lyase